MARTATGKNTETGKTRTVKVGRHRAVELPVTIVDTRLKRAIRNLIG